MALSRVDEVMRVGALEIRAHDGLVIAGGDAVFLTVRELELLVALAERAGRVVRREELYRLVWGEALNEGNRSIDVYIRKLRVKLLRALPHWRFIHTHVGFGYRLDPQPSPPFHSQATAR